MPPLSFYNARLGYGYVTLDAPFLQDEFVQCTVSVLYNCPLKSSGKSERKILKMLFVQSNIHPMEMNFHLH